MTAGRSDFVLSGTVTSAVPVYALVAYLDPEGNSDYDARMSVALPKPDGTIVVCYMGETPMPRHAGGRLSGRTCVPVRGWR